MQLESKIRHIPDSVFLSLKMEGIRLLFSYHWGTDVVESQINQHVGNHVHGQNVGFFASQTPDVAGNLRKLPYPLLNPTVYCVGCGIDKVALDQVFFFSHFGFSMPLTIP
jgi:hypothetical protein